MRGSGGNEFMRNLGATVRDNPVPMALMSTGLAWLMLSGPRARRRYDEDDYLDDFSEAHYGAGDYPAGYYPTGRGRRGLPATAWRRHRRTAMSRAGGQGPRRGARRPPRRRAQGQQWRGQPCDGPERRRRRGRPAVGSRGREKRRRSGAPEPARRWRRRRGGGRFGAGARARLGDTGAYLRHGARGARARAGPWSTRTTRLLRHAARAAAGARRDRTGGGRGDRRCFADDRDRRRVDGRHPRSAQGARGA